MLLAYAPSLAAQELPFGDSGPVRPVESAEKADAKALASAGLAAFDAGRYAEAIEKFEAAYQGIPAPGLLYNLAQAYRLQGDCVRALARYRAFLATGVGEKMRELAEERVAELEPCPPSQHEMLELAPATSPALPSARTQAATPLFDAKSSAAPRSKPDSLPAGDSKKIAYASVGYGTSLVLLSIGAYFGVRAHAASDRISEASERGRTWNADLAATERSGKRAEAVAVSASIGGLVSLGVTTCLLAFDW